MAKKTNKNIKIPEMDYTQLLKKRELVEESIKKTFSELEKFIIEIDGNIFYKNNYSKYGQLEGNYNRSMNAANLLNDHLPKSLRISNNYKLRHKRIVEIIDRSCEGYIREECNKIIEGRSEEDLIRMGGLSNEPYVVPTIRAPDINSSRKLGYE